MRLEPTEDEARAIRALTRLAKKWPASLWLFSASGTLCVMRAGPDGDHIHNAGGRSKDGVDSAYILDTIDIPNDGGDW